ncbi:MAG: hypothetical protein U0529_13690 [Thermoanaerobaculia bacterium]
MNHPLTSGDPAVAQLSTPAGPIPGPFAGKSMSCRNCHLVDDASGAPTSTYGDYARRSAVPERGDGRTRTPRSSPPMVNALLDRDGFVLHFDGQFATPEDLIRDTLTGRNFGWLPDETDLAIAHVARVIREDDGTDDLAPQYGNVSYRVLLAGTDPAIAPDSRIPAPYRVDVLRASDREVLDAVAALIAAYLRSLTFAQDGNGLYDGSPYDLFLARNGLPRSPAAGETAIDYARRLRDAVEALSAPAFVTGDDGGFEEHDQEFAFGPGELRGLRIFLREPPTDPRVKAVRVGNCVKCHAPPHFTDFSLHNTGASQDEYDSIHGDGSFARLRVPDLATRAARHEEFLPATREHPNASGRFQAAPAHRYPERADLGAWNVFANPDFPAPQPALRSLLAALGDTPEAVLPRTIGLFKTPGLRDLGQSAPYLHTGRKREIEDVLDFYREIAAKARQGKVRNASPELSSITLGEDDVAPLAAFLRSLNEDYN